MNNLRKTLLAFAAILGLGLTAQAHIVGLGYTDLGGGSVKFDALHWHGALSSGNLGSDYMTVDGVNYYFTSFTNNTSTMTGLTGALVNSSYSSFAGGTLTALGTAGLSGPTDDWMHVTITGLAAGNHTLTAPYGSGGLTSWTLNGGITSTIINTSVPDSGSTLVLLGLAMLGLVRFNRVSKQA